MRSATSTPLSEARAASSSLPLMAGSGVLPPSVTLATSRSADQTKGRASGTRRVSSLTSRTPGTASTEARALRRPSSENASAARLTSRPETSILVLSSTVSLRAAALRLARLDSSGAVLIQAARAQRTTSGIRPGHHLLLHLKSPCIRRPAVWEQRENKPLRGCQTRNNTGLVSRRTACPTNRFFSGFPLVSEISTPTGQPRLNEAVSQQRHPRRTGS